MPLYKRIIPLSLLSGTYSVSLVLNVLCCEIWQPLTFHAGGGDQPDLLYFSVKAFMTLFCIVSMLLKAEESLLVGGVVGEAMVGLREEVEVSVRDAQERGGEGKDESEGGAGKGGRKTYVCERYAG